MSVDAPPAPVGAFLDGRRANFRVWAPAARTVDLVLSAPHQQTLRMDEDKGYHTAVVDGIDAGQRYGFQLDGGGTLPDPASRHQPDGVHGLSAVVARTFDWTDSGWRGHPLDDYVIYELHVGTFTGTGTFDAAAKRIPELRALGMTVVELMPVAQFPGCRNWGYDGVLPYATQNSYGGPAGLKRFVDQCHDAGLAVCLDVVYNHLGPEGNYLGHFGPYFTDRYHTPWGDALNFDGHHSDAVRAYFINNALQWIDEFHIDALRLDAVHAILDQSAHPFLQQLAERVHERASTLDRTVALIAESDLGDPRVIRSIEHHGLGMDAQWLDDFHHSLHTLLTGEQSGYYGDFGRIDQLARAYRSGYVYTGQYSQYRQRSHGMPAPDASPPQFVVYAQNHDQIGNRMLGDRLGRTLSFEQLRLAATAVLLSPFTPMLFMGEEYGEVAPFPYFVSHSEANLVAAVRDGRAAEFAAFAWAGEPPDPQAESTFRSAILNWDLHQEGEHALLVALHRELLRARAELMPLLRAPDLGIEADADAVTSLLRVHYRTATRAATLLLAFGKVACDTTTPAAASTPTAAGWRIRIDTTAEAWGGHGRVEPDLLGADTLLEMASHSAVLLVPAEHRR